MSAAVIIPTTGNFNAIRAIESVMDQTVETKAYVVVDGSLFQDLWNRTEQKLNELFKNRIINYELILLPTNTGGGGFYGHRIYAGIPHLLNEDYIFFLDQDNFYEPNHVESLINVLKDTGNYFAYSLRNIVNKDGGFLMQDNCESLGYPYPKYNSPPDQPIYHIDTSCYAFRRGFLIQTAHLWHGGFAQDRRYYVFVRHNRHQGSGLYTMNYRLDGNPKSLIPEYIELGNKITEEQYKGKYPWAKQTQIA
jgi:hypothetical protein